MYLYLFDIFSQGCDTCLHATCLAAAAVASGSGDLELFALFRGLALRAPNLFGNQQAAGMAVGLLFLGGGGAALCCDSDEAVAALLCAFFPLFPRDPADSTHHLQVALAFRQPFSRFCFPSRLCSFRQPFPSLIFSFLLPRQALRHLYVLAARPALATARDAESGRPLAAALTLGGVTHFAPCIFGQPLAQNALVRAACEGHLPAAVPCARLPLTVWLAPSVAGKCLAEFDWEKWWRGAAAARCGSHGGWGVALLRACGLVNFRQSLAISSELAPEDLALLARHYRAGGAFPKTDGEKAQRLAFLLACFALPPPADFRVSENRWQAAGLALALGGRVDYQACLLLERALAT